jgi:hypothetical protein
MLAQQIKEELNTFKMVCFAWMSVRLIRANFVLGNGGTRELEDLYTLFLMKP